MVLDDQTEDEGEGEREPPNDSTASTGMVAEKAQYKFSARSLARLDKVHPDLVRVVKRAIQITGMDFTVVGGIRTLERQKALLASGATQTLHSRHLTGHAVDLAPWIGNQVSWHWPQFDELAKYIKLAAADEHVPIEWGVTGRHSVTAHTGNCQSVCTRRSRGPGKQFYGCASPDDQMVVHGAPMEYASCVFRLPGNTTRVRVRATAG